MTTKWTFCCFAALAFLAGCATPSDPSNIIAWIPDYPRQIKLVDAKISKDGTEAALALRESSGVFAFDLNLSNPQLRRLTLLILDEEHAEGVTLRPPGKAEINLKSLPGVDVIQESGDVVIEVNREALMQLRPGGRFQFINQFR